ncbi:hypothetical protein CPAR01_00909, partial [Colletotrichum paranaense]
GLKDEVKNEIFKLDLLKEFLTYIELAIRIDTRLYK